MTQQLPDGWTYVEPDGLHYGPFYRRTTEHQQAIVQQHKDGDTGRGYGGYVFALSDHPDESEKWSGAHFGNITDGNWDLTLQDAIERANEIIAAAERRNAPEPEPEPEQTVVESILVDGSLFAPDLDSLINQLITLRNLARDLCAKVEFPKLDIEIRLQLPDADPDAVFVEPVIGVIVPVPQWQEVKPA